MLSVHHHHHHHHHLSFIKHTQKTINTTDIEQNHKAKILTAAFEENIDVARISLGGRGVLFFLLKVDDLFSRRSRYTA